MYRVTRPPRATQLMADDECEEGGCPTSNLNSLRLWESGGCSSLCKVRDTFPTFFPSFFKQRKAHLLPNETAWAMHHYEQRKVFYIFIFFRLAGHAGTSIRGKSCGGDGYNDGDAHAPKGRWEVGHFPQEVWEKNLRSSLRYLRNPYYEQSRAVSIKKGPHQLWHRLLKFLRNESQIFPIHMGSARLCPKRMSDKLTLGLFST